MVAQADAIGLYPADGQPRSLWVAPAGHAAPAGPSLAPDLWLWGEVRSGIATITAPIVEAFVPQMLNYESVGGVNFKKGCYPGQEVVARSQFRGTLKRRAYLAHAQDALQAGQEIFHEADPTQPCGLVAQAAAAPGGGWDAIVSIQIAASQGGRLTCGSPQGAALTVQAAALPLAGRRLRPGRCRRGVLAKPQPRPVRGRNARHQGRAARCPARAPAPA